MARSCKLGVMVVFLCTLLFAPAPGLATWGFVGLVTSDIRAVVQDSGIQWVIVVCLTCCLAAFLIMGARSSHTDFLQLRNSDAFLCVLILSALICYALAYRRIASSSTALLMLFLGIVLGKAVSVWVGRGHESHEKKGRRLLFFGGLISLLSAAALWQADLAQRFEYRDVRRWGGAWNNPNLFGLLMGLGVVLWAGIIVQLGCTTSDGRKLSRGRWTTNLCVFLCFTAATICGIGLFKSYSRGAWIATASGLIYFAISSIGDLSFKSSYSRITRQLVSNWAALLVIVASVFIFLFWQFRWTDWAPARRLFSAANVNDFSWRNRVTAWKGAIRMMKEKPWIGYGWGQAESVYEQKYCPPQLESGAAIRMNDYFMLGISAGVPALVCFLVYVGLSLRGPKFKVESSKSKMQSPQSAVQSSQSLGPRVEGRGRWEYENGDGQDPSPSCSDGTSAYPTSEWIKAVCRAGAIVLLVGFWFDGGLFKLATGSVFWILLELGRVESSGARYSVRAVVKDQESGAQTSDVRSQSRPAGLPHRRGLFEVWLRRLVWLLGAAALLQTAVLLGTPFLGVNKGTLAIARRWLVPPKAIGDLNFLASEPIWRGEKLRVLVSHTSLANYNRELINWKLGDEIYRDCVLTPAIDPKRDGQLNWRRSLWEYFYPPIRKENDPEAAAQIVLKYLHDRTLIVSNGPLTIEEMWQQKKADTQGFEALKVAAFRSVGIPARLNDNGYAEIFMEGKWKLER